MKSPLVSVYIKTATGYGVIGINTYHLSLDSLTWFNIIYTEADEKKMRKKRTRRAEPTRSKERSKFWNREKKKNTGNQPQTRSKRKELYF